MGKIAFVFPGQGSQKVGMGREAFEGSPEARAVFEAADRTLGEPLSRLCFEGPEEELRLTANTQPAILATSVALLRALGERPDVVAGHSLGEYTAHVAAGSLGFEDAVRLLRARGTYMQEAVPVGEGAMAAVLGAEPDVVERICSGIEGVVQPANFNSPGQIVIAGSRAAVEAAAGALKEARARVTPLPVSAPFHCALMKPAEERLAPDIAATSFSDPGVPVYVNVDAVPVTNAAASRDALIRQVSRPVRWQESVERMVADGVTLFVEVGQGTILTGLIRRIAKDVQRINVQRPEDFEAARQALRQARG